MVQRLFAEKLDALADPLDPGFGFDLIRLAASHTVVVTEAQRGFDTQAHQAEDVAALADKLSARLGARRVIRYLPQDTHIPERAALAVPVQHCPPDCSDAPWPARADEPPLRPLRLLQTPEPVEVMAGVPDGPPAQFIWRRVTHRVARAEGPERIAMEWWRAAEPGLTRDYFRVEDDVGRAVLALSRRALRPRGDAGARRQRPAALVHARPVRMSAKLRRAGAMRHSPCHCRAKRSNRKRRALNQLDCFVGFASSQ